MFWHIVEREIIHFFSSAGVYLIAYFALRWAQRNWPEWTARILPALLSIGFIFLREPYDVIVIGDPLYKSYIDYTFWFLGMAVAIWGLKRYVNTQH